MLLATHPYNSGRIALEALGVSLTFGVVVWALRAATQMAAICGAMICCLITAGTASQASLIQSGLSPLILLFLLTFIASRAGRAQKIRLGLAEGGRGRNAAQVIANLGTAGLVVIGAFFNVFNWAGRGGGLISVSAGAAPVLLMAPLCEATADTVSSEIGAAFGGWPFLLTTFHRVEPGTDGAISWLGTATGVGSAGIVAGVGMWALRMRVADAMIALVAGLAGLVFDSLLGATVERKGWLGNDLVNFSSTLFAAAVALALMTRF